MLTQLQKEQAQHQAISDQMMAQCKEEEAFRQSEIAAAEHALTEAAGSKAKCEESLGNAQKDQTELTSAQDSYTAEKERAEKQRDDEHESYSKRKADLEGAIAIVGDLHSYASNKINPQEASFAQKSATLLKTASKLRLLDAAVPVLLALATAQIDGPPEHTVYQGASADGNKLLTAISDLLNRVQVDHDENERIEAAAQAAYDIYHAKLVELLNTIADNLAKTIQQITDMTNCVSKESEILATAAAKNSRNSELLDSANQMCNVFAQQFIEATQNRLEEIQTINEILAIIAKRFGKLPADLITHLENVQNGWEAYVNSTQFQEYVEYQQQHTADDAHGADLTSGSNLLAQLKMHKIRKHK